MLSSCINTYSGRVLQRTISESHCYRIQADTTPASLNSGFSWRSLFMLYSGTVSCQGIETLRHFAGHYYHLLQVLTMAKITTNILEQKHEHFYSSIERYT
jgi:hypothetical protein